ncbi:hypothetical protein M0R36_10000 [bacterium]|jgi:hypothetical protein|nr:hypothetical protein [bacterium]
MDKVNGSLDLSKLFGYESRILALENEVKDLKKVIKQLTGDIILCKGRRKKDAVIN